MCLRYDRSLAQRKHFIHEAKMSSSLNHENILHLHGVVLPGLYTDSVALVSVFLCRETQLLKLFPIFRTRCPNNGIYVECLF